MTNTCGFGLGREQVVSLRHWRWRRTTAQCRVVRVLYPLGITRALRLVVHWEIYVYCAQCSCDSESGESTVSAGYTKSSPSSGTLRDLRLLVRVLYPLGILRALRLLVHWEIYVYCAQCSCDSESGESTVSAGYTKSSPSSGTLRDLRLLVRVLYPLGIQSSPSTGTLRDLRLLVHWEIYVYCAQCSCDSESGESTVSAGYTKSSPSSGTLRDLRLLVRVLYPLGIQSSPSTGTLRDLRLLVHWEIYVYWWEYCIRWV